MLKHLHIQNLALIEDLTLEFQPGLTVFTGETGAGKTLILEALSLLFGARANPALIRSGESRMSVEGILELDGGQADGIEAWLEENGLESEEKGEILIRREIQANGRSRAWINARLTPLAQLEALGARLAETHAQHDQLRLMEPAAQRELFDDFAGLGAAVEKVREAYEAALAAQRRLEAIEAEGQDAARRREFLAFQIEELRALELRPGEMEALEGELRRMRHVEELRRAGSIAGEALSAGGAFEQRGAIDLLGEALNGLETMARLDPAMKDLLDPLREALIQTEEAARALRRYVDALEADPARLDAVEERLEQIRRALRKHGGSEEQALRRLQELEAEFLMVESLEETREAAAAALREARERLSRAAGDLRARRKRAAKAFLRPLTALLKEFALPQAQLEIEFRPVTRGLEIDNGLLCGPNGADELEILFSANPGEAPQPLRKIASGGELSRLMIALRSLNASRGDAPILVLDEVDAGVSGLAVSRIAERLRALGERMQVIYVTHQAAMAAVAHRQFRVEKRAAGGRTRSLALALDTAGRQQELARLLDGGKSTGAGMALAAELLEAAS